MTTKIKIAAALTALTLATTFAMPSSDAQARPRFGTGLAVGLVGGALLGAAIASQAQASPVYYGGEYRRCRVVAQYDSWGNYAGRTRVCDYY